MIFQIQLQKELAKRLEEISQKANCSKEKLMIDALEQHLDDIEAVSDYEQQKRDGTLQTYTLEEIKQKYDLE